MNPDWPVLFRRLQARRQRLVVVAPHPDDEILGAGLALQAAIRAGVGIAVIALTDGQASHPGSRRWPPPALGRLRRAELRRALARAGAARAPLRCMGWRDGKLSEDGSASRLARTLRQLRAGLVGVTCPRDHHADHQAAFALVHRAAAVPVLTYAVWSRLAGPPGPRVRDPGRGARHWAMAAHRSQLGSYVIDDPQGFAFDSAGLARLLLEAEDWRRNPFNSVLQQPIRL